MEACLVPSTTGTPRASCRSKPGIAVMFFCKVVSASSVQLMAAWALFLRAV